MCAVGCRKALELAVKWVYAADNSISMPYKDNLASLLHEDSFKYCVDQRVWRGTLAIWKLGNHAVHSDGAVKPQEAIVVLRALFAFVDWIDYCYGPDYVEHDFDERKIPPAGVPLTHVWQDWRSDLVSTVHYQVVELDGDKDDAKVSVRLHWPAVQKFKQAVSYEFINDEGLNDRQIAFVHRVIDHIEKCGYMEPEALVQPPFDRPQSFARLFDRKRQMALVKVIRKIKENALKPAA